MQTDIIQSMHERVRAIHRALTGEDVVEGESSPDSTADSDEEVTRRFVELEAMARAFPSVIAQVPPFSFTPALDVLATADAVVLELAVPGIDRDGITVEPRPDAITVRGVRHVRRAPAGDVFHAEIPRGPFHRTIPLPFPIEGTPRIELEHGVLRIYLTLVAAPRHEGQPGNSDPETQHTDRGRQGDDESGEQRDAAP